MNVFSNKKPITRTQAIKARFGTVFIVNDKKVFNPKGKSKSRRVVIIGKKSGSLIVAPIRRCNPYSLELSNFDNQRSIRLDKSVLITKNKVYSKNGFKNTQNDFLTNHEKVLLKKKIIKLSK